MKICWTPTARITYFEILDYLAERWTILEIKNFADADYFLVKHKGSL